METTRMWKIMQYTTIIQRAVHTTTEYRTRNEPAQGMLVRNKCSRLAINLQHPFNHYFYASQHTSEKRLQRRCYAVDVLEPYDEMGRPRSEIIWSDPHLVGQHFLLLFWLIDCKNMLIMCRNGLTSCKIICIRLQFCWNRLKFTWNMGEKQIIILFSF